MSTVLFDQFNASLLNKNAVFMVVYLYVIKRNLLKLALKEICTYYYL